MGETKQRKEGREQAQRAKMNIGKRRGARTTDTHFFKFKRKKFAHLAHYAYLCTTKLVNTLVDKPDL